MLSNDLVTNEIKNGIAAEVEFTRISLNARQTIFASKVETPTNPNRLRIEHTETGTGINRRRKSLVRFDNTTTGQVDTTTTMTTAAYTVLDAPVGNMTAYSASNNTLAQLISFLATTGAGTTVLFDCTGNGAAALVNGTL
jgi:hypothetical protein